MAACGVDDRKQAYYDHGVELLSQGDRVKARLEFKNVLQIDPKYAPAWYQLAEIEAAEENWSAAFGDYGKVLELDPENTDARIKRGRLLFSANQLEDALKDAELVLASDPKRPEALALRGMIRAKKGDMEAGIADAEAALAMDPKSRDALVLLAEIRRSQNELAEAEGLLQTAVEAHPDDVSLRVMLASILLANGEPASARQQLEQAAKQEPDQLAHVARLVAFDTQQGQLARAEETLKTLIAARPNDEQPRLLYVQWVMQQKGIDSAAEALKDFISKYPDRYSLRFALADLYRKSGKADEAIAVYREIADRDEGGGDRARARGLLAGLLLATDRQDEAESLVAEVLGEDARNMEALMVRAAISLKKKDPDQAVADLRNVLQNHPESVNALRMLAAAHEMRDEISLAQDALEKAVEAAPEDPQAYLQLAQLRFSHGDAQGASSILQSFLERVSDNVQIQSALARIQLSQQNWEAMKKTADQLLRSKPDHPLGHYLAGLYAQHEGDLEASVKEFQLALEKRPDAIEPKLALARSRLALGQSAEAERRVQEVLDKQPVNTAALNLLGEVYLVTGRLKEAREQYAQLIVLYPELPSAYVRLSDLQARNGDLNGAVETLQKGVEATNRNAFLVFRLAQALQQDSRIDEAFSAYEEVLKSNPNAEVVINNLAMLLANDRKDDPESLARARELVKRFEGSDQWVLLDTLGWVQFRAGELHQAVETLDKVVSMVEKVPPEVQYHQGMIYAALGRRAEAKDLLDKALAAQTDFPGIEEARRMQAQLSR
ncbi:tetratricopeptide repeat protein [Imhoffiella purpurea]|uniref:Uncharacterized protein n=1 Tax=Imhoffiella purpurea TaxID=1249627 RepID=W9V863_9GAMM|nr:tetratricopeptide repeat protein [Imhoffiella purpurea]EXJ15619.1 hypothetical protein D779_1189 [Imhoffiella purpurea]